MTRKEWLEKFIWLANQNKPARDFRTKLSIRMPDIPSEIKKLGVYMAELQDIIDAEELEKRMLEAKYEDKITLEELEKQPTKMEEVEFPEEVFEKLSELPQLPNDIYYEEGVDL